VSDLGVHRRLAAILAAGALTWDRVQRPFGPTESETGPAANAQRFPGQLHDQETELYYNYFRDYDPGTGRYIETDSIGLAGGLNTYGYVGGNPLSRIDITGLLEYFTFELNNQEMSVLECECGESFPAFSGLPEARDDPSQSDIPNVGPVLPGDYYIVDRPSGGRLGWLREFLRGTDEWFALYRDDGTWPSPRRSLPRR
jgi:RHS repeat-associated protein